MEALYSSFSASLSSVTKVTQILPQVILWQFCFRCSVSDMIPLCRLQRKKLSYEIIKIIGSLAKIWLYHLPVTCFAGFWTSFLVLKLAMKKRNKRVAKCVLTIFLFYFFNLKTFDNKSAYQSWVHTEIANVSEIRNGGIDLM